MVMLFFIPLLMAAVFLMTEIVLMRLSRSAPRLTNGELLLPILVCVVQCVVYLLIWLLHGLFMAGEDFAIPLSSNLLFCAVTDAAVILPKWFTSARFRQLLKRIGIVCTVLLLAEIFFFNAKSFTLHPREQIIPVQELEVTNESDDQPDENSVMLINGSAFILHEVPEWTRCATLQLEQQPKQSAVRVRVFMSDENFYKNHQISGHKLTSTYGRDVAFLLEPYGSIHELRFDVLDVVAPMRLDSVTCLSAMPFSFSAWRFNGLLLILSAVLMIHTLGLTRVVYDHRKLSHSLLVYVMTCLCTASVLLFWTPEQELIHYPEDVDLPVASPYEQTLDAFESGHAWLNIEPDPELVEFEYRFDRVLRDNSGIPHLFDRALYDGKYYSYFGIAPVLTFYYPVYWLTGSLPTTDMACMFYAPFTVLLLCLTILTAVRLCCKRPNLLLLLMSLPVSTGLCGVYYPLQFPNIYDVVVASGLCFTLLALWSGLQAYLTKQTWKRCVLLAVCGIACVMSVQSRPSMAITVLILAPYFIGILRDKGLSVRRRTGAAVSFGIPVLIGAAATMYYNMIRFSSPFDFGAGYQLTISNIQANHVRLSALPAALFHYFFQLPTIKQCFPFLTLGFISLENYHMYTNIEHTVGMLAFPMLLLAMLLLPRAMRSRHCIGGEGTAVQGKVMVLCAVILSVLVAWADFCLGGVSLRYSFDFMPILLIAVNVILLGCVTNSKRWGYHITILCICLTFVMLWLLMLQSFTEGSRETVLMFVHPTAAEEIAEALLFWE